MAYLHGHAGSILAVGATINGDVESWRITQALDSVKVFAKGQAWKTLLTSAKEFSAEIVLLLDDLLDEPESLVGHAVTVAQLIYKTGGTNGEYVFAGTIVGVVADDPIDGPARLTLTIEGDGTLVHNKFVV